MLLFAFNVSVFVLVFYCEARLYCLSYFWANKVKIHNIVMISSANQMRGDSVWALGCEGPDPKDAGPLPSVTDTL